MPSIRPFGSIASKYLSRNNIVTKYLYSFVTVFGDMAKLTLFLVGLMMSVFSHAQQLSFDIWLMNKKIGTALVTKSHETGGHERYKMYSSAVAKVLFTEQKSEVTFDVLFKGGQLLRSLYKIIKEEEQVHTTVDKTATQYNVVSTLGNRTFTGAVPMSSIQLYFKEPVGVSKVFVERLGNFLAITKTAPGTYEYTLPDGIKNIYRYKNGVLQELEIKKGIGSVYMKPAVQP
jgi:hypothetical protein